MNHAPPPDDFDLDPDGVDELVSEAHDFLAAHHILACGSDPACAIAELLSFLRAIARANRAWALVLRQQPTLRERVAATLEQQADAIVAVIGEHPQEVES